MSGTQATVLVAGGAGFLGSHLCDQLVAHGHSVVCLDNFSTGSRDNLVQLNQHEAFSIVDADVTTSLELEVEAIFNLACPASPEQYQRDPVATTRTNVMGAINLLDLARRSECKILQASTSEVYGDPAVHPQVETYWGNVNPIGIRSCYDEGKRCAETLFFDHHRQYDLDIKVARIFNTYGPRMQENDGRVVSNFIVAALRNADITLYGNGHQTRSFCYVDDQVQGLLGLMNTPDHITGPINIGNPNELSISELADRVIELTGSRSRIVNCPLPGDDPMRRCPDITKARTELNWEPKTSLDAGLVLTIQYFDELLTRRTSNND